MLSRPALLAPPLAAALLILLTACSSPAPVAAASSAAAAIDAAKQGASAVATPSAAASAAAAPVDACKAVPVATVSKIMGHPYVTAQSSSQGGDSSECDYDTKGISLFHLTLQIQRTGGKQESSDDQQAIRFEGDKPIPLSGIGDSAYEAPKGSDARIEKAYGALWGDAYATVGGPVEISEDQAKQLLTAAHAAL